MNVIADKRNDTDHAATLALLEPSAELGRMTKSLIESLERRLRLRTEW